MDFTLKGSRETARLWHFIPILDIRSGRLECQVPTVRNADTSNAKESPIGVARLRRRVRFRVETYPDPSTDGGRRGLVRVVVNEPDGIISLVGRSKQGLGTQAAAAPLMRSAREKQRN